MRFLAVIVAFTLSSLCFQSTSYSAEKKVTSKKSEKKLAAKKKAGARKIAESGAITVQPMDGHFPTEKLGPNYHEEKQTSKTITPYERDGYLERAGLASYVKNWDHFDRDILVMRVNTESLNEVAEKYPNIPSQLLKALKEQMQ